MVMMDPEPFVDEGIQIATYGKDGPKVPFVASPSTDEEMRFICSKLANSFRDGWADPVHPGLHTIHYLMRAGF